MSEVNLLRSLPTTRRNIQYRTEGKSPDVIHVSKQFGEMYFDGPREYGYGGYRYDGRWVPVARDIVTHFGLRPGQRVLDVGCAKGFLVKDLMGVCSGLEVFGIDVSEYALRRCEPEVVGRLYLGTADRLPFPDGSFDAVLSINTLHNLPAERLVVALREIDRLAGSRAFIQVDAYRTPEERERFLSWMLTAETHGYPEDWFKWFREAGYKGDHWWTVI
jgi:ubiquinone/menaquinone biosynthesis C-methylase UbiE